jgi:hypothetical protein
MNQATTPYWRLIRCPCNAGGFFAPLRMTRTHQVNTHDWALMQNGVIAQGCEMKFRALSRSRSQLQPPPCWFPTFQLGTQPQPPPSGSQLSSWEPNPSNRSRSQLESWERAWGGWKVGNERPTPPVWFPTFQLGTTYGAKFHFAKFNKRLGRIVRWCAPRKLVHV